MAKVFDITDKLNYEESPIIKVKGIELHVNDDAETMLQVMGKLGDEYTPKVVKEMYELLIQEADRAELAKLKLNFDDFSLVVKAAVSVATGKAPDFDVEEETKE